VLLDEPAAGVNPTLMARIRERIVELNRERGITFLLIEHDMPLVMGLSDRILCMADGEQIALGTPQQVQQDAAVVTAYLGGDVAGSSATAGQAAAVEAVA
jgi:ABC-type branched-subunit amino acid transport system ATPase component